MRAYGAASASGLTGGHNYGIMSLDGNADPVPSSGGAPSTAPVPGLEVNASSGAIANRYDDASAVATSAAAWPSRNTARIRPPT